MQCRKIKAENTLKYESKWLQWLENMTNLEAEKWRDMTRVITKSVNRWSVIQYGLNLCCLTVRYAACQQIQHTVIIITFHYQQRYQLFKCTSNTRHASLQEQDDTSMSRSSKVNWKCNENLCSTYTNCIISYCYRARRCRAQSTNWLQSVWWWGQLASCTDTTHKHM